MQANQWAALCHLCGLVGYMANGLGSIIAPAIVWYLEKEESPLIDEPGKEAINFNISITIYAILLLAFAFGTLGIGLIVVIPLLGVLAVFHVVCTLMGALNANQGLPFRYPLTIRLLK